VEKSADICLVVEGSYPYITGGVSSWIQWLINNMADYSFSLVALIAEPKEPSERKYPFPENVVSYQEFVLFDYSEIKGAKPLKLSKRKWRLLSKRLHQLMQDWRGGILSEESLGLLRELIDEHSPRIFKNFMVDEGAFALLTQIYEEHRGSAGFVKYFYNFQNIHLILFRVLSLISQLPQAGIYHAPQTGYGGLAACLRAVLYGGYSVITEHGVYLQEREMELLKSNWLDNPYLKDMWIDMFSAICRWQYHICDQVITLFPGNIDLQLEYGAKPDKVQVIPNGVDIERFKAARKPRCIRNPRTIGLVGRVDSVKDVKTYIHAMAIIHKGYPEVQGLVIGPHDEQPDYYTECRQLIDMLDLNPVITFTGRANVIDYYVKMDLLLLTSIKEGMPLVIMEAMASGIPVVATAVGACTDLLYGMDDGIGKAGLVSRVVDAEGIADAALSILKSPQMANTFAQNGIQRVEQFYREQLIIREYKKIYKEALNGRRNVSAGKTYSSPNAGPRSSQRRG
jgi:glycosyltransferase involved in cell wall biosynthesis